LQSERKEWNFMKRLLVLILGILSFMGTAMAAPIVLPTGPIFIQYNNLEQVNAANSILVPGYAPAVGTQGNWGVLNISSIQFGGIATSHTDISGGTTFFADDGPGGTQGQVTGIFYGIQIQPGGTTATGGTVDLFWHDAGTDTITTACMTGAAPCGPNAATVGAFASGTFLVRINFASGIINGNPTVTLESNTDPTINASGHSDAFGNVNLAAPGPWTNAFNGDWFFVDPNGNGTFGEPGETRDLRFSTFYNGNSNWDGAPGSGTSGLRSNDPARAFNVPETNTLPLLVLSLGGLGLMTLRKKSRGLNS
jgi:hypothetical protein